MEEGRLVMRPDKTLYLVGGSRQVLKVSGLPIFGQRRTYGVAAEDSHSFCFNLVFDAAYFLAIAKRLWFADEGLD